MGEVYEAYDPHLKRSVAVKFLGRGSPEDVHLFLREARAQAAQNHPDICPVYEAGETAGKPYIVMKLVEGVPLDEATRDWTLEKKLGILRRIADAVHAAHRTGLIHRDLKPGNLLVEQTAEGEAKPYVLDFGLACPVTADGVAADEEAIGTPAYMAPEQVRGNPHALDRRTDVYALGATLYHLLAGWPPFAQIGTTTLEAALRAIATAEPPPLRPLGVPGDVEAIVFKCLEKEPERRYRSAQALAEDLGRYLDDVPVEARPHGGWFRFWKWTQRNRKLVRVGGVLGVLLFAALLWAGVTSWQARERERQVRRYTEQVEEMEALARYSHMAPLHDVRPDRELVRQRMTALRADMERSSARAAGHYALGRGFLALEDPEAAYRELETAWEAGYQEPEVGAALALALSGLYREGLAAAELLGDWESRQRRLRLLEERYGAPARVLLEPSSTGEISTSASQLYHQALAAFHAGRFEQALALLARPSGRWAWSYELDALEGDVRRSLAIRLHVEGDASAAREQLESSLAAYDRAARIAPSHPELALATAQVTALYAAWDLLKGEDLRPVLDRGLRSAQQALAAQPDDARSWLWRARLERLWARSLQVRSEDPLARLGEAAAAAERAATLLPDPSEAQLELARISWARAQWLRERGEDVTAGVEQTIAALSQVAPPWRDYAFFFYLGSAHMTLGDQRRERGEKANTSFDAAIAAFRSAADLHSTPFAALSNLGICLFKKSELREAAEVFEKARLLEANHVTPPYYLGQIYLRIAQGGNPASGLLGEEVGLALESYRQALALNPRMVVLHNAIGELHHLQAIHAWEQGEDSEPYFALARKAYAEGLAQAPGHAALHQNLGWTAYFQGKFRVRSGKKPGPYFDEALRHTRRALELSKLPGAQLCVGSVYRLKAESAVRDGDDPSRWLERSQVALYELLELNPDHPEAHRSLGRLHTLEAQWRAASGADPRAAFERARESLERALALEPTVASFHLAMAQWALERERWQPSPEIRELGLARVRRALELKPGWAEATSVLVALRTAAADAPR